MDKEYLESLINGGVYAKTPQQFLLVQIWELLADGKPHRATELAIKLNSTCQRVTQLLLKLRKADLIERQHIKGNAVNWIDEEGQHTGHERITIFIKKIK